MAIDLPLDRGRLTFVNRLLPTVQGRRGPEEDVVGFADWITGEAGNPTPADVVAACQRQWEDHYQRDLLSIAVQFDQGSLKNRFWRVITGFFQGRESLPLNMALLLGARILHFEGVAADAAESLLLDYSRSIPNPTSSRLVDPAKHHALENDIRRAVEFTDQERQNIRAYLLPVLSSRDTKGKEPLEVAVKLADCIVRLVSAKEKQGTGVSTAYLQQYIKGETGICCENKIKFGKIKEALIALGFIKVLRQGRQGCGATYYGLAGRLAYTFLLTHRIR